VYYLLLLREQLYYILLTNHSECNYALSEIRILQVLLRLCKAVFIVVVVVVVVTTTKK
jgi:hypothetical protein